MSRIYSKLKEKQHINDPKVHYLLYLDHPSEPRDDAVYGIMPGLEAEILESIASLKQKIRHIAREKRNRYPVK